MVKLLVVSASTLVRVGLVAAVSGEADMAVVGATGSTEQACELCSGTAVDVVLVESPGSGEEALRLCAMVRRAGNRPGVVLIGPDDDSQVLRAIQAGGSAYLPTSVSVAVLLATVRRAAAAPGSFTAPDLAALVRHRSEPRHELSPREGEVLMHLRAGSSLSTIAHTLLVSESTIKTYASRIYDKLGVRGRAQAVEAATRSGLLP